MRVAKPRTAEGRLISLLRSESLLTERELAAAEQHADRHGLPLIEAIVNLGLATKECAYRALARASEANTCDQLLHAFDRRRQSRYPTSSRRRRAA